MEGVLLLRCVPFLISSAVIKCCCFLVLVSCGLSHLDPKSFGRNRSEINYTESPIIAIGLPKTATTSLRTYLQFISPKKIEAWHYIGFGCHKIRHPVKGVTLPNGVYWHPINHEHVHGKCFIATMIQNAIARGKPPLHYVMMNGANAIVQPDCNWFGMNVWPQIDALDLFLDAYPTAYYIHNIRNVDSHVKSMFKWYDTVKYLETKGMLSRFPTQNSSNTREQNVAEFIKAAQGIVRDTFFRRPDHRYLEVDVVDDPRAGEKISIFVGAKKRTKIWWVDPLYG